MTANILTQLAQNFHITFYEALSKICAVRFNGMQSDKHMGRKYSKQKVFIVFSQRIPGKNIF